MLTFFRELRFAKTSSFLFEIEVFACLFVQRTGRTARRAAPTIRGMGAKGSGFSGDGILLFLTFCLE
jgi:hypothetical protein